MSNQNQNARVPLFVFLALAIGVMGGYAIKNITSDKPVFSMNNNMDAFDEILLYVNERYVDSVDVSEIREEAIEQALAELDPHSYYLPKELRQNEDEQMLGEYEGIGVEFSILNDTITVARVMKGGPSEEAGIEGGDQIIFVEDEVVAGVEIDNTGVIKRLKGPKGSSVNVRIKRFGEDELIPIKINRGPIPIRSVDAAYMLNEEVGYVKINRFSETTAKEFKIHLEKLVKSGMSDLILDLRGNRGGSMNACLELLDELIGGTKLLLSAEGRRYRREEYDSHRPGKFEQGDLIVLIDQNSASASEIVAGAVQDWDRGLIVGRRSYGKGLVQQPFNLTDGGGLNLTVARYYTPSGRSIQRPYDDGIAEYRDDLYERFTSGELLTADSIKVDSSLIKHTLVNGRAVFGGGGIYPDVFIPIDTSQVNNFSRMVYNSQIMTKFTFNYIHENKDVLNSYQSATQFENQFLVNAQTYQDFVSYAKQNLTDEPFDEAEVLEARNELSTYFKALLARQFFENEGFYTVMNDDDEMILRSLELFRENFLAFLNPAE